MVAQDQVAEQAAQVLKAQTMMVVSVCNSPHRVPLCTTQVVEVAQEIPLSDQVA
jgi:hypothetical protein